jgi:hypothetical protein
MAKKKSKVSLARQAALQGEVDTAVPLLRECAREGDDSACASLAELLAFLGHWDEVVPNAARLIANPFAVYAGNVFTDMVGLLGRAGHDTGAWQALVATATEARRRIGERLDSNDLNFPEVKVQAERARLFAILDRLADYARGRGAPPHELVRIFAPPAAPDEAAYRGALEHNKGKPPARLLSLAIAYAIDAEAIRLFPLVADATFEDAVFVGKALVRRGEADQAWEVVAGKLSSWSPVDEAQVAPVVLLTDELLRQITGPERAKFVVRTPRAIPVKRGRKS